MKCCLGLSIVFAVSMLLCAALRAESATRSGSLLLMGGYERFDNMLVWDEFRRLAGGPGKKVALLAAASSDPQRYTRVMAPHLQRLGLLPVIVAPELGADGDLRSALDRPEWIATVQAADAVFLLGGDQSRYRKCLLRSDGSDTRMLQAIRAVHRRGGLIAGTSAGTAVMSEQMFVDGQLPYWMLKLGSQIDKELDQGFGFLPAGWFVDQHFLYRGRLARTLVAMQKTGLKYALGIDEDTAIAVDGNGRVNVVGHSGVLVIDVSHAERDTRIEQFNWRDVRLSYLSHGDQFDLKTMAIKVSDQKPREYRPTMQPDVGASRGRTQVHYDVFNQDALSKLMFESLLDSSHAKLGLCLNPDASLGDEVQDGFQLQLRVLPESVAWKAPFGGGNLFSVLHLSADIKPIRVQMTYQEVEAAKP